MSHRWAIVALSLAVFLSTIPLFMMVGKRLPPAGRPERIRSHVPAAAGSSLEGSSEFVKQLEAELKTLPGVRDMLTMLGADQRQQVDRGSILVELVDPKKRE